MNQATRILFTLLDTGDVNDAKAFLRINSNIKEVDIVRLLLGEGAGVNAKDPLNDWSPLHYVVRSTREESLTIVEVAQLLIDKGADVNMQSKAGKSVLLLAIKKRKHALIRLLLESGANVNTHGKKGRSPLHIVMKKYDESKQSDVDIITLLINKGADINKKDNFGEAVLCRAIKQQKHSFIRLLLDKGADVNIKDSNGSSLLHWVMNRDESTSNKDAITCLVEKGADVNIKDNDGETALHRAIMNQKSSFFRLLLEKGATVNVQCYNNLESPLHYVMRYCDESSNNIEVIELLLDKGVGINLQNDKGQTALHQAIMNKKSSFFRVLLENEAIVNLQDNNLESPLHYVVRWWDGSSNNIEVIKLLIDKGVEISMRNKEEQTALDLAILINNSAFIELLRLV